MLRPVGQRGPQLVLVDLLRARQPAVAEHGKEIFVLEIADAGQLQFQQGVLPRIHVDGHDLLGAGQGVIQGIAAGGGDHQHRVIGREFQCLVIEPGIFQQVL